MIFPRPRTGTPDEKLTCDQKESAAELGERYLECGPHELAWVRDQVRYLFATRCGDGCDSEYYATDHELAGKPRYRWVDAGEGVRLGWLAS